MLSVYDFSSLHWKVLNFINCVSEDTHTEWYVLGTGMSKLPVDVSMVVDE